jgi:hypothetical protein
MIRWEASIEAGGRIDRSKDGAGPAIGRVLDLLKPEAFYVSVFKREMFMVVNCDDPAHLIFLVAGTNPEVTAIMTGEQAMTHLPKAIANAASATAALGF